MNTHVLVAYATKYGATAEIAGWVGDVLRQAGLMVDVLPVDKVKDLFAYHAIVLGSAVYIGQWRKEAVRFLRINEALLTMRPVWLFSSGPTGQGDPVDLLKGWLLPKALQSTADRIQPRGVAVFFGNVDMKKLNFIEKAIIRNVKAPAGDFRALAAISAWAGSIAEELLQDEN